MEKCMAQIKNPIDFEDEKVLKRTNILNELLLGQDIGVVQDYLEQCGLERFHCDIRRFYLLITGMRRDMYIRKGTTPYKNLKLNRCFAERIIAVLGEGGDRFDIFLNNYDRNKLLVFLITPGEGRDIGAIADTINGMLQTCYENGLSDRGAPFFNYTVVSRLIGDISEIGGVYQRLLHMHAYSFFDEESRVAMEEGDCKLRDNEIPGALMRMIDREKEAVLKGEPDTVRKTAWEMLLELKRWYSFSVAEYVLYELRGAVNEAVSMYGLKEREIEMAKGMKEYHSVSAMMRDVENMCAVCAGLTREVRQRYSLPTIKAMQYISANYRKAITQGEIAAYIGVSAQYLSSLFNSEMHLSIPEYIRQVRFEEIKRELRQTNRPASRIARDNGYQNLSYFYQMFKKAEGCTAAEYREQALDEEE